MTCYIVGALASVANSAPSSLLVNPLLPEMKLEQGIVDRIVFGHPMPQRFESILCPGEDSANVEKLLLVQDIFSRVEQQGGRNGRHLMSNFFAARSGVERETQDYERTAFWNRTLQDEINTEVCQDLFDGLVTNVAEKGESFSFESPIQSTHENSRRCLLLLVSGLSTQPEVCWIGVVPGMVPLNLEAQWVSQSRQSESRPFFDVGLDGTGQVIGISDTGLDTDNCYFWDASGEVPKDGVSSTKVHDGVLGSASVVLTQRCFAHTFFLVS